MKELERRLVLLEKRVELRREAKRQHEPFYHVKPWSILKDQAIVSYFPEGLYQPPEKYENLSFAAVVDWVMENRRKYVISFCMSSCTEWLFLSSQNDPKYTEEQTKRFREYWLEKYPELKLLYTDAEYMRMREAIGRLPQNGIFSQV